MIWSALTLRQDAQQTLSTVPDLRIAAEDVIASIQHGAHSLRRSGGSEDFWQYREYNSSDRPQDIDWRYSGRTERVYVREKELKSPQSTYFWCARGAGMDFKSDAAHYTKKHSAQILSLALALIMQRQDEQIGFIGDHTTSRTGRSDKAVDNFTRYLLSNGDNNTDADNDKELPIAIPPAKSTLVLVGDFLSPLEEIEACLDTMAHTHRRGVILQTLDPAEIDLPYSGHVVFEHADIEAKIDNVGGVRDQYRNKIKSHLSGIRDLCHRYHWHYCLHRSDAAIGDSVLDILSYLEQVRRR